MDDRYQTLQSQLEDQFNKVFSIMEFDKDFIEIVISQLDKQGKQLESHGITNHHLLPYNSIKLLESICQSGPKRSKYKPIYSQSIVLLVSYFSSTISSIFNDTLTFYLNNLEKVPKSLAKEEFKFNLSELNELEYDLSTEIGRMIARKADISFQDMQSIYRAFKRYFNIEIEKNYHVDNIITAQSLRHAIVHNAEIIDNKCKRQIDIANNRTIERAFSVGDTIEVNKDDLVAIADSMKSYVSNLTSLLLIEAPESNSA